MQSRIISKLLRRIVNRVPRWQIIAFISMFYPEFVLSEDVLTAKLASLPVYSLLVFANISSDVLITVLEVKCNSTLFARSEHMGVFTLFK